MPICKTCPEGQQEKSFEEFAPHPTRIIQSQCRLCRAAYNRKHYKANKQKYRTSADRQRARNREWLSRYKTGKLCVDCGHGFHPAAMEFDHTGTDKIANVSRLINGRSRGIVLEEIKKCDLVCANCHAVRTWARSQRKVNWTGAPGLSRKQYVPSRGWGSGPPPSATPALP